jgi:CheY-like chemotaxis protein
MPSGSGQTPRETTKPKALNLHARPNLQRETELSRYALTGCCRNPWLDFTLPDRIIISLAQSPRFRLSGTAGDSTGLGNMAKVLAVDDELDVLLIVRTALQSDGYEVETASNGTDALALARDISPDLILLDVMMPGMSGFDVLRELKADESTCTIPVIMLTGLSERSKIQEALTSGTDYYIVKPFDFHDLLSKINDVLQNASM